MRLIPYSDHNGHYRLGWVLLLAFLALAVLGASVYLIYVLEILKFRTLRSRQLRAEDPDTDEHQIVARVARDIETGDFERVR
jgi:hypothetical protein